MTPEAQARLIIDTKLLEAGWQVQDLRRVNLGAAVGVAVREYPTDTGPADYVLFVNREPVGVIEARPDSTILTFVEYQTECYARYWFSLIILQAVDLRLNGRGELHLDSQYLPP